MASSTINPCARAAVIELLVAMVQRIAVFSLSSLGGRRGLGRGGPSCFSVFSPKPLPLNREIERTASPLTPALSPLRGAGGDAARGRGPPDVGPGSRAHPSTRLR